MARRKKAGESVDVTIGVTPRDLDRLVSRFTSNSERRAARLALSWALVRLNGPRTGIDYLLEQLVSEDGVWRAARTAGLEALKAIVYGAVGTAIFEIAQRWYFSNDPVETEADAAQPRPEDRATILVQRVRSGPRIDSDAYQGVEQLRRDLVAELATSISVPGPEVAGYIKYNHDFLRVQETLATLSNLKVIESRFEALRMDYEGAPLGTINIVKAAGTRRASRENREATATYLRTKLLSVGLEPEQWTVDLSAFVPISYDDANELHSTYV